MKSEEIVRSWKDEDYRVGLNDAQQALLPDHPAGLIELTDAELTGVEGGTDFSLGAICGQSNIKFCMPTLDYGICSCFGCLTFGLTICIPYLM